MKERKIFWKGVSFKEHMELNNWWTEQGIVNDERRFLMFCDKEIKVWLQDLKTGEKHLLSMGSKGEGINLALKILNEEMRD